MGSPTKVKIPEQLGIHTRLGCQDFFLRLSPAQYVITEWGERLLRLRLNGCTLAEIAELEVMPENVLQVFFEMADRQESSNVVDPP